MFRLSSDAEINSRKINVWDSNITFGMTGLSRTAVGELLSLLFLINIADIWKKLALICKMAYNSIRTYDQIIISACNYKNPEGMCG